MTRTQIALISAALAFAGVPLLAQDAPTDKAPKTKKVQETQADKIKRLVAELGAPKYEEREAAYKALVAVGAPALSALEVAKKSSDPEVRAAASEAIAEIKKKGGKQPGAKKAAPPANPPKGYRPLPPLPKADQEFFKQLEQGLPKDMQSLMERLRKQGGGGGLRMLSPDDPMVKELLKGLMNPRRFEKMFEFGQGGQGGQGKRPGQPRTRSRSFTWSNVPSRNDAAGRLGVRVRPVSPALRYHLSLPQRQGVVLHSVAKGSFAASQGLQRFDILLSVDGKPLRRTSDLSLAAAGGKLALVRRGKHLTHTLAAAPAAPRRAAPAPRVRPLPTPKKGKNDSRDF
jgi:hypothetical protein